VPDLVTSARRAPYEIMMVVPSIAIDNVVIIAGITL